MLNDFRYLNQEPIIILAKAHARVRLLTTIECVLLLSYFCLFLLFADI